MKFWDMPWAAAYNTASKNLVATYKPPAGLPHVTYQQIQWANYTETFSSAVASSTGPAVSTGGGFQAFQFAQQGAIAYADHLVATFKKDGTYNDFLPGQIEAMKTPGGYTTDTQDAQWKAGKFAMGIYTAGLDVDTGISNGSLAVMPGPLTWPHGDRACLVFQNNIMMYKNTPRVSAAEERQGGRSGLAQLLRADLLPEAWIAPAGCGRCCASCGLGYAGGGSESALLRRPSSYRATAPADIT